MRKAAGKAGVSIVTGDTKVVEHGKCDKIFINTTGVGIVPENIDIGLHRIKKGDAVIVTGDIGNHGICILSTRDSLGFETSIQSDTAALTQIVSNLLAGVPDVHILRDPTRGGLSSTLNEIAEGANVTIAIDENELPISSSVNAACDLLGLDPLYVANEGIMLVFYRTSMPNGLYKSFEVTYMGKRTDNRTCNRRQTPRSNSKTILRTNTDSRYAEWRTITAHLLKP